MARQYVSYSDLCADDRYQVFRRQDFLWGLKDLRNNCIIPGGFLMYDAELECARLNIAWAKRQAI
jgi:hypothetical protein